MSLCNNNSSDNKSYWIHRVDVKVSTQVTAVTCMHQSQPSLHSLRINLMVHLELWPGNHLIWCNATCNIGMYPNPLDDHCNIWGNFWPNILFGRLQPFEVLIFFFIFFFFFFCCCCCSYNPVNVHQVRYLLHTYTHTEREREREREREAHTQTQKSMYYMGYFFRLAASVLLYAPSYRQDSTHHGLFFFFFLHQTWSTGWNEK